MLFESFALQTIDHLPIRRKTFATYHSMLRLHVFPTLAHRDIRTIKRLDIQGAIQGLPPQTSAMSLAVIKTVFREALAQEIVEASPAHGVSGPTTLTDRSRTAAQRSRLRMPTRRCSRSTRISCGSRIAQT